jgi:hypothetical protein
MSSEFMGCSISGPDHVSIDLIVNPKSRWGLDFEGHKTEKRALRSPTNNRVIFSPSHIIQDLPKHVNMCILGGAVEPFVVRV